MNIKNLSAKVEGVWYYYSYYVKD